MTVVEAPKITLGDEFASLPELFVIVTLLKAEAPVIVPVAVCCAVPFKTTVPELCVKVPAVFV